MEDYTIDFSSTEVKLDLTVLYKDDKKNIHEIKVQSDLFLKNLRSFQKKFNEINLTKLIYIEENISYDIFINFLNSMETKKIILNDENYPKYLYLCNKYEYIELKAKIEEFMSKRPDIVSIIDQLKKKDEKENFEKEGQIDFAKEELVAKNLDICLKNGFLNKIPLSVLNRILNSPKRILNDHHLLFSFVLEKLNEYKENGNCDEKENLLILPGSLDYCSMTSDEILELFEIQGENSDFISPSNAEERLKIFISNEKRNENLSSKIGEIEARHTQQINELEISYSKKIDELASKCSKQFNDFDSKYNNQFNDFDSKYSKQFINLDSKYSKQFIDFDSKYSNQFTDFKAECAKQIKELETKFENKFQEINKQHQNEIESLNKIIDGLKQKIDDAEKTSQNNSMKNEKKNQEIEKKEEEIEKTLSKHETQLKESVNKQKSMQDEIMKQKQMIEKNEKLIQNINESCIKSTIIPFDNNDNNRFNGIISWLGKKNPEKLVDNGILDITASSIYSSDDIRQPKNVLNYNDHQKCFNSGDCENSWLCIDFKENRVNILHYSIHAHDRSPTEHLFNWEIEGSNNKESWDTLDSRQNDKSISTRNSSNTFEVQNKVNKDKFYKYIRIRQTDKNTGANNELYFSSIEFFGRILQF